LSQTTLAKALSSQAIVRYSGRSSGDLTGFEIWFFKHRFWHLWSQPPKVHLSSLPVGLEIDIKEECCYMVREISCTTCREHTVCLVNDLLLVVIWFYKIKDKLRYLKLLLSVAPSPSLSMLHQ